MSHTYIHFNPEREEYSLTDGELENIKNAGYNPWKDFSLVSLAVGIPCIINAISELSSQTTFQPTLSFVINLVFGALGIVLGIFFLILWRRARKNLGNIVKTIKEKPIIELTQRIISIDEINEKEQIGKPRAV